MVYENRRCAKVAVAGFVSLLLAIHSMVPADVVPWSTPGVVNTNAATDRTEDYHPDLDFPAPGRVVAAWMANTSTILFSSSNDGGVHWTAPVDVVPTAGPSDANWLPDVAADNAGNVVVVWQRTIYPVYRIVLARSTDFGQTWGPLNDLTPAGVSAGIRYQVTHDGRGTWMIAWASDSGLQISRSVDQGATWTTRNFFSGTAAGTHASSSDIQFSRNGVWMVVWRTSDGMRVWQSRSTDEGRSWSSPVSLGGGDAPQITTDRDGNWVAAWNSDLYGVNLMVSRSSNDGLTWSTPALLASGCYLDQPGLATDGAGTWMTVWEAWRPEPSTCMDLYYSTSKDNGLSWSPRSLLVTQPPYNDAVSVAPTLVCDRMGHWAAAWYAYDVSGHPYGADCDIYCQTSGNVVRPPRVYLVSPKAGKCISGNSVLVKADVEPPDAAVQQVLFEYRAAGSTVFAPIPAASSQHPNPDTDHPYFIHWNVQSLPVGNYELRAGAMSAGTTYYSDVITVSVQPDCGQQQSVTAPGEVSTTAAALANGFTDIATGASDSPVAIEAMLPPGAVPSDTTVSALLRTAASSPGRAVAAQGQIIGSEVDLQLGNGQAVFSPDYGMRLTFDYPDQDNNGTVDGTSIAETQLRVCRLEAGAWHQLSGVTIDPIANRVSIHVFSLGTYSLQGPPSAGVNDWQSFD